MIRGIHAGALSASASAVLTTDAFHAEQRVIVRARATFGAAARRYLLVDNTKLGRVSPPKIAPITGMDLILTDSDADPAVLATWDATGIRYEVTPA